MHQAVWEVSEDIVLLSDIVEDIEIHLKSWGVWRHFRERVTRPIHKGSEGRFCELCVLGQESVES
jgi:hypothetical protein